MNIAIFGGIGFIGSSLSKLYHSKGHKVSIFTQNKRKNKILFPNKIKIIEIKYNLRNLKKINFNKFNKIHFLSGNPSPENSKTSPDYDLKTTNKFSAILLELLKKQQFKGSIWIASSVAVYGNKKGILNEKDLCEPISIYGVSKLFLEKYALLYSKKYSLNIGIYRIFSTYGPGLKRQLIYDAIKKIHKNKYSIDIIGTGFEKRDLTYIDDITKGIYKLNKTIPKGHIYNIGSGKSYSVKYIVNTIMKIMNKKLQINFSNKLREYDGYNWKASINKIKKTGYKPNVKLIVGLKKTIDHFFKYN